MNFVKEKGVARFLKFYILTSHGTQPAIFGDGEDDERHVENINV